MTHLIGLKTGKRRLLAITSGRRVVEIDATTVIPPLCPDAPLMLPGADLGSRTSPRTAEHASEERQRLGKRNAPRVSPSQVRRWRC
jgi:hypothetical protein